MKELLEIQHRFSSSKNLHNDFANFDYRNLEVMLKDLKPILYELGCTIQFSDRIVNIGSFNYLEATCTITNSEGDSVSNVAYAREEVSRPGNSAPQLTGMCSTYCRRYALCGLVAVDSGEPDPDSLDNRQKEEGKPQQRSFRPKEMKFTPTDTSMEDVERFVQSIWEESDSETKHRLSAFHTMAKTRDNFLTKYGCEKCWEMFWGDCQKGKYNLEFVKPEDGSKGFWLAKFANPKVTAFP